MNIVRKGMGRRYRAEKRFKRIGLVAIIFSLSCLATLFISIIGNGHTAFLQTVVKMDIYLDPAEFDPESLNRADYQGTIKKALRTMFPQVTSRGDKKKLYAMISTGATFQLMDVIKQTPDLIGTTISLWVPADDDVDMFMKGYIRRDVEETDRRLNDLQISWIDALAHDGRIKKRFNTTFFTSGDSREPELAGIWGATCGSFYTLLITLLLSFPVGVAAAVYLEEFAPKNRFTDLIEVNINNLAAVPSIVFGLLGLAVFLNLFGLPRSSPLVGGLVLTLMTLPTIIIASRAALKSVPPSVREAALSVGASKTQMVSHHVLPLALPGMLTGTIIGMAQALGETAPLLMIGMVAFIVDIPGGLQDPSTVLPVQIFLWADSPERAFLEKTSAAIMVLLAFLVTMNAVAVFLRKKFERRW
ncbi:MAG: phosphate ABC transporter permease PstA [Proteobacteria bacterium]|nr:phosphate ABC transporter permease PstA [Pseudomonadota bacterium]MBU1388402.1 phosphate ABC transporter permease PstA [Pseudomonadota bacterium]MBU1542774.1 phosphate ABC transporter permease PstA [Pseudomonadota bacterium]MBU2480147.1 phosphate ABC transporter permease PstA [Pseudomonadota bacterium]